VRLRGLPFSLNEVDVAALFAGLTIRTHGIHMVYSAEEKPTGEAFVEFETERDVEGAVAKHKSPMGHRYVEVFRSSPDEMMLAACGDWELPESQPQPTMLPTPSLVPISVAPTPMPAPAPVQTIRRVITVTPQVYPRSMQPQQVQQSYFVPPAAPQFGGPTYPAQAENQQYFTVPHQFDMSGQADYHAVEAPHGAQMGMAPQFAQIPQCDIPYMSPGMY